ncbi:DUF1810 domain-containing protein [Pseudomonas graminis]|uniref:Uncharacterized protein, DUF1810 family n=1 Tax=Pseudomonas graminis TaxID=158627 RepID=A0A1I0BP06_9PSED|nr:DUF1810 domain-containing protein [Pseudomonas graminis]SET08415.1 Uncharacterized protein, DUF1810 family [Pseudomonas graminis]
MNDPFDLQRFVEAQTPTHERALAELQSGRKQSHWMWFVFPQLAGLGHSDMARRYGISGRDEAIAYVQHPVLGERLARCCEALLEWKDRSAMQVMGSPDDMKLRSSMTLFAAVAPDTPIFQQVLDAFFDGKPDAVTLSKLA